MTTPYDLFLGHVQGFRSVPPKPGFNRAGRCFCPSHQPIIDKHSQNRSLAVSETSEGVVLINCKAGCSLHEVTCAVGMDAADLFPKIDRLSEPQKQRPQFAWQGLAASADGIEELSWWLLTSKTPDEFFVNQMNLCDALAQFKTLVKQELKGGSK